MFKKYTRISGNCKVSWITESAVTGIRLLIEHPPALINSLKAVNPKSLVRHGIVVKANDKVLSFHDNDVADEPFATMANVNEITDVWSIYHGKKYTPLDRGSKVIWTTLFIFLNDAVVVLILEVGV
jgi:xylose isomerase